MFEKYIDEQPVATKTLLQSINDKKLSHAYLFETNDYYQASNFIMDFVTKIFVSDEIEEEKKKNIIRQIKNNEYIELKIIKPDGIQIKKEEMIDLQNEFKSKSIGGLKKVYVIYNAEKLNSSSANSILKFLEEPEENIIAILITDNRYKMIDTILSRCQLISLINVENNINKSTVDKISSLVYNNTDFYNKEEIINHIEKTINFLIYFEKNKKATMPFINREYFQYFNTREVTLYSFEIMKLIYLDVLKIKTKNKLEIFEDYTENIKIISDINNINAILYKINKIIEYINRLKTNVNINLLMDTFMIELGE